MFSHMLLHSWDCMAMDRIRTHGEMYSIQHKLIKCDSDLQQVGGSLQVLGSEKLIQIQYVLRQAKHFNYSVKIPPPQKGQGV